MSSKAEELREVLARKKQALELRKSQRAGLTPSTPLSSLIESSSKFQTSDIDNLFQNVMTSNITAPKPQPSLSHDTPQSNLTAEATTPQISINTIDEITRKRRANLVLCPMEDMIIDIVPRDSYSKEVQTSIENIEIPILQAEYVDEKMATVGNDGSYSTQTSFLSNDDEGDDTDYVQEKQRMEDREKSEEEAQKHAEELFHSLSFGNFFRHASLYIERCINQPYDPLIDYTASVNRNSITDMKKIHLEKVFYDETWCKGKSVTGIACSAKYKELFLATYYSPDDGLIIQWNRNLPHRYEQRFECETPVSIVKYNTYDPNIIVGGTYSGQILVWDSREKPTPVQRSTINSSCHTQPIFGLELLGTNQLDQIVSMSTDGKICIWNPNNLSKPSETVELYSRFDNNTEKSIMTYAMSFQQGETNKCYIGSENGNIYSTILLGSNSGIESTYYGHQAPVTAVHSHPMPEFGDLILSSSMDWSSKLWSHKYKRPLLSIDEFGDYVYDVQWSPVHPALFASVDGSGMLSIWNLNKDLDLPILSEQVCENSLNKVKWTPDGRFILTGAATGHVHMFKLDEDIAVPKQVYDETQKLKKVRQDLISSCAEQIPTESMK